MVRVERREHARVIVIDRPERRNALDGRTLDALAAALDAPEVGLRAVVIGGAGGVFVSGGDLQELRNADSREDAERLCTAGRKVTARVAALAIPVIAALDGPAVGGGAELAVACDLRIASARAWITFKHARMGVTPAWSTLPRLRSLVGAGAAARLLFTACDVGAFEARQMGLIDAVVERDPIAEAVAWAHAITLASPSAVAACKSLLRSVDDVDLAARERDAFVAAWSGPDHAEAMAAHFERRPPSWAR